MKKLIITCFLAILPLLTLGQSNLVMQGMIMFNTNSSPLLTFIGRTDTNFNRLNTNSWPRWDAAHSQLYLTAEAQSGQIYVICDSAFQIKWNGKTNKTYSYDYTSDLIHWTNSNVHLIVATNNVASILIPADKAHQYYRIWQE